MHLHEFVASRVIDVVVFPSVGELVQDRERIARAEVDPRSRAVAVELPSESVAAFVVLVNMDLETRQCEPSDSECCIGVCDLFARPLVRSVNNMRWGSPSENGSSTAPVPMGGVTVASKTLAAGYDEHDSFHAPKLRRATWWEPTRLLLRLSRV